MTTSLVLIKFVVGGSTRKLPGKMTGGEEGSRDVITNNTCKAKLVDSLLLTINTARVSYATIIFVI